MPEVSVVICCANVADTLEAACRSVVAWADELVIVDSGSADATAAIAQRYASRYVVEPWRGYTGQIEFGVSLCRNDWVLVLDGDEECAPELAREIQQLGDDELAKLDLMTMRRETYCLGRPVRSWRPDWQTRLIHRRRCTFADELFHYRMVPTQRSRQGKLRGRLIHRRTSAAGFNDYFDARQLGSRLQLIAQQMYKTGRRCRWYDLFFRPLIAVWKSYIVKRGFLDGMFGLMIAGKMMVSAQLKWAALWAYQEAQNQKNKPDAGG
ncbi:MAG: glycosyltransferase family 2 protein [Phycisphaeraceae bacterium]